MTQPGRRRRGRRTGALLLSLALAGAARAGPPFLTDDPEPTDTGHWEIYAPFADVDGRGGDYGGGFGAELNYGAAEGVQLTFGLPVSYAHDASGLHAGRGDLEASVKYRFYHDETAALSVAFFPGVTLPTARRGFGHRRVTALLPLWVQKDAGKWSVFSGGGYAINPGVGNRGYWTGGAALARAVSERLLIGVEVNRTGADAVDSRATTSFGLGMILKLGGPFRLLGSGGPTFTDGHAGTGFHAFMALGIDI
ncbi:hypothetical protein [Sphingomonas crusticola]|uniref:hypothetical protein n=1 Tax=Sphingomonas crusticola TaxID=1697973 RepID=UPI000E26967B|nr:hypothetical protein [Sphingomonas crusticola]